MICLLLIMIMVFFNGIESAEQKINRRATGLREEEINAKTKAWLLMVESGKVDEENIRRITPKSIFIAPLLTGQNGKCKDGYRHDHLGQCVKVIKIEPKVQLELLLKRLNMLYSEKNDREERPVEMSNEPLHFSIPIFNEDNKRLEENVEKRTNFSATKEKTLEHISSPPLPILFLSRTNKTEENVENFQNNQTKEIEASGMEPPVDTKQLETSLFEGSGFTSGDLPSEIENASTVTIISEDMDYTDVAEEELTSKFSSTITEEIFEEISTTLTPFEDTNSTESYQRIAESPNVNESVVKLPDNVQTSENSSKTSSLNIIHFPDDEKLRTYPTPPVDNSYIRFPDDSSGPFSNYQTTSLSPNWNSQFSVHSSVIPRQQFWWLPENWKIDETPQKSTLVKFWSRLPLIHDISFSRENKNNFNSFSSNRPHTQTNQEIPTSLSRGKPYSNIRYQEVFKSTE